MAAIHPAQGQPLTARALIIVRRDRVNEHQVI